MKIFSIIIVLLIFVLLKDLLFNETNKLIQNSPAPTPYQFPYQKPQIAKNRSYRIIIVGDSIVGSLGPNANRLREKLIAHYPGSEFVTYNYGYPATNIESLVERFTTKTSSQGKELPPILGEDFELLIIESFGYNPLSHYSLSEGLNKQNEILEKSVRQVIKAKPNVYILFMTPIAPDPENFARGTYDLSDETRKAWVEERIAYIKNHQKFADEHGISLVNLFDLSHDSTGFVIKKYIGSDFIHPSAEGVEFMSRSIADFIFQNQIFPN